MKINAEMVKQYNEMDNVLHDKAYEVLRFINASVEKVKGLDSFDDIIFDQKDEGEHLYYCLGKMVMKIVIIISFLWSLCTLIR